jgi:hypothetical protein
MSYIPGEEHPQERVESCLCKAGRLARPRLPRAAYVDIECAQVSIQARIPIIAVAAVIEQQTSFELVRKEIVSLGLSDPLRDPHF